MIESGVTWSRYQNEWEGEPDYSNHPCPEAAPYYLQNELDWLWCNHQQTFGVPAGTRWVWTGWYQKFEGGVMLTTNQNDTVHILFDFSRVEIVQATDEDVERFAVQVGNDTDPFR